MIKAVLFDLDGTLLDTVADIHYYVNDMLAHFGYAQVTRAQTQSFVGDGAEELVRRALGEHADNFKDCFAYFIEQFSRSLSSRTTLYPNEMQTLTALKESGKKLAVVTNKPQIAAEQCIKGFFPESLFDGVFGDSGNFPCKPDPTIARYAALTLRVSPAECAFVGDGETDALTAQRAGMRGVSCLWGYRTKEQLSKIGATEFISDFKELLSL